MNQNSEPSKILGRGVGSSQTDWESLSADIRDLPSVQNQIAERAYQIYLDNGLPEDAALDHWLAAEKEASIWIYNAITCTTGPHEGIALNPAGDR